MKHTGIKIFLASFLFAVAVWFFTGLKPPTTWEYSEIAKNIIERYRFSYAHLGTEYLAFCPPLYSLLVSAVYLVSNYNNLAVIFFQIVIYSLLCVVIYGIGKNIFNNKTGIISVLILTLHPGIMFYTLKYEHSLILDIFMIALSALCILRLYNDQGSIKKAVICGIALGFSFLARGTALVLLPLYTVWLFIVFKLSFKKRLFLSLLITLISIVVILPWTMRNYIVTKKIMLIGAAQEECLWRGNNPNASGSSYNTAGKIILNDLTSKDFLQKIYASDEMGQKRIFKTAAFDFIKNNPGEFIRLFLKKIYYFWWFSPQSGIAYPALFKRIYQVYYIFIVIGAFFGIYFMRKQKKEVYDKLLLLTGVLISISFLQSIFYVEIRHRWGVEPLLVVLSASGWVNLYVRHMRQG